MTCLFQSALSMWKAVCGIGGALRLQPFVGDSSSIRLAEDRHQAVRSHIRDCLSGLFPEGQGKHMAGRDPIRPCFPRVSPGFMGFLNSSVTVSRNNWFRKAKCTVFLYFIKNETFLTMAKNTEIRENVCRMRAAVGQPERMGNGEQDTWTGKSIIIIIIMLCNFLLVRTNCLSDFSRCCN